MARVPGCGCLETQAWDQGRGTEAGWGAVCKLVSEG